MSTCIQDFSALPHYYSHLTCKRLRWSSEASWKPEIWKWTLAGSVIKMAPELIFLTQQWTLSLIFLLSSLLFTVYFFGSLLCHHPPIFLPSDPLYFLFPFCYWSSTSWGHSDPFLLASFTLFLMVPLIVGSQRFHAMHMSGLKFCSLPGWVHQLYYFKNNLHADNSQIYVSHLWASTHITAHIFPVDVT